MNKKFAENIHSSIQAMIFVLTLVRFLYRRIGKMNHLGLRGDANVTELSNGTTTIDVVPSKFYNSVFSLNIAFRGPVASGLHA